MTNLTWDDLKEELRKHDERVRDLAMMFCEKVADEFFEQVVSNVTQFQNGSFTKFQEGMCFAANQISDRIKILREGKKDGDGKSDCDERAGERRDFRFDTEFVGEDAAV